MFETLLQRTYSKTIEDTIYNITQKQFISTQQSSVFDKGCIVFKVPINKSSINTAIDTAHCLNDRIDSVRFHSMITEKIIQIKQVKSFKDALQTIEQYRRAAPHLFYGAVLKLNSEENVFLNPYHILTASALIDDGSALQYINNNNTYDVLIYFLNPEDKMTAAFCSKVSKETMEQINNNIDAILLQYQNKIPTLTKVIKTIPTSDISQFKLVYKVKRFPDEDPAFSSYIVPTQLLTKGIVAPFYATNLIKIYYNGAITRGASISPFKTCNISNGDNRNINFTSVCTGSTSNKTIEGLMTLTHANLNSPYGDSKQGIPVGGKHYIDAMINKSLLLYEMKGILE